MIFQISSMCYEVFRNIKIWQKSILWTPQKPQKSYIDPWVHQDDIFKKSKKIEFFGPQNQQNFFRDLDLRPMQSGHHINMADQYIGLVPQKI